MANGQRPATGMSAAFVFLLYAAGGCGLQPIPEVAVEGTTVVIPVPGFFEVGYGTRTVSTFVPLNSSAGATITGLPVVWTATHRSKEDFQRGEMLVTLMQQSGSTYQEVVNLKVQYVAAVAADPGSFRARTEYPERDRQNALVVEIPFMRDIATTTCPSSAPCSLVPDGAEPAQFYLRVQRIRRTSFTAGSTSYSRIKQSFFDASENLPNTIDSEWYGWGDESAGGQVPSRFIPIKIVDNAVAESVEADPSHPDHPKAYTGLEYWYAMNIPGVYDPPIVQNSFAGVVKGFINNTVAAQPRPDPEFQVRVSRPSGSNLAAWHLVIPFPGHRITISDVRLIRAKETGAWVNYSVDVAQPSCSSANTANLVVDVADPDSVTMGVIVSYRLRSESSCLPTLPLVPSEFGAIAVTGYDSSGGLVAGATHQGPMGPDFEDL